MAQDFSDTARAVLGEKRNPVESVTALLESHPNEWRKIAHIMGPPCVRSTEEGAIQDVMMAAGPTLTSADLEAFRKILETSCRSEVLRAWEWVPRESWSSVGGPQFKLADAWLSRRDPAACSQLHRYAVLRLVWLSHVQSHDVLRSAVVDAIDAIPEASRDHVARLMRERLSELGQVLHEQIMAWKELPDQDAEPQTDHADVPIDTSFLEILAKIGDEGVKHAKTIADDLSDRLREHGIADYGWLPSVLPISPPRRLATLAIVLYRDVVEPEQARLGYRRSAIVRAVLADRLMPMMARQTVLPELDDGSVRDERGRIVGRISLTTPATLEAVRRGAHALGTVAGNRLIRTLIHRSHDAWNRGEHDPRSVVFSGGWDAVLETIAASAKQHTLIREIAMAGQCIVWETESAKYGGLWTYSEVRGRRNKRGEISFVLGDALTPGYGEVLSREGGTSLSARIARRLVPELRFEPPMGGARERDQGAIWTLHRLMLLELVDHAEQLAEEGGVVITRDRWRALAATAGVPLSIVDRTLRAWCEGESERAPALVSRDSESWTLAEPHMPERKFIADGGSERAKGRRRGKRRKKAGARDESTK